MLIGHFKLFFMKIMKWNIYQVLSLLLFGFLLIWILLTFNMYGTNWDEPFQHQYGREILRYYSSSFHDTSAVTHDDLFYYGGLFEGTAEIIAGFLPFGVYDSRHLIAALTGLWGIIGAFLIGRIFAGNAGGFFSSLLVALFPTYVGHMFNNSKDIPFAAAYLWGLYSIIRSIKRFPEFNFKDALFVGIFCGIASGIRIGGILLFYFFILAWGLFSAYSLMLKTTGWKAVLKWQWGLLIRIPVLLASSVIPAAVFWPWLQAGKLKAVFLSLDHFTHLNGSGSPFYIPKYYMVKFPEWIFLFSLIGFGLFVLWLIRKIRSKDYVFDIRPLLAMLILFLGFALASLYPILQHSKLYNEIRQMIFAMLPLLVVCGISIALFLEKIKDNSRLRVAFLIFMVLGSFYYIYQIVSLIPYQYSYFNRFAGKNLEQAFSRYQGLDYYECSKAELIKGLKKYLEKTEGINSTNKVYTVSLNVHPLFPVEGLTYYFPPWNLKIVDGARARFVFGYGKGEGKTIYSIIRQGVVYGAVNDREVK